VRELTVGEFFGLPDYKVAVNDDVSLSTIRHDRGLEIPCHRHELGRICIILSGELEETHGNASDTFPAGHVLFWPPGTVHRDRFGESANRTLQVEFSAHGFGRLARYFPRTSPHGLRNESLEDAVPRLLREIEKDDVFSSLVIEAVVYEILARAARLGGYQGSIRSAVVRRAIDYVAEHIGDAIKPRDLAAVSHTTAADLNRRLHTELGMSTTAYIRKLRLQRAEELLGKDELSIGDVAFQAGYYDSSHMTKEFRTLRGLSPLEFRRISSSARH